jgi:hypothetical protein
LIVEPVAHQQPWIEVEGLGDGEALGAQARRKLAEDRIWNFSSRTSKEEWRK